jgi:hypothetical protein
MKREEMKTAVDCATAEDLLREMSPATGTLWEKSRRSPFWAREWVFRGVSDANYRLQPSAFRRDAFVSFIPGQISRRVDDPKVQRQLEDSFLTEFCTEADRREIEIPSDNPELRDIRRALVDYSPHEFPPINKLHMFALAQHYGVPTRLLDWSRHPLVATYFAVRDVALVRTKRLPGASITGEKPCAVWALDLRFVRIMMAEARTNTTIDPAVYAVTAPYATNPNLAAQGGLFTLVQPRTGDPHPIPDVDEVLLTLAEHVPEEWSKLVPVLVKFTLPAKEARTALRLLEAEGVTAASIRPGIQGVVDAMRERWAHQTAEPGSRS